MTPFRRFSQGATKAAGILHRQGSRALLQRAVRVLYTRSGADLIDEPISGADIAGSTELRLALPASRPDRQQPIKVGWVTAPPAAGSGGHTTLFRMVEAVEAAGHECVLFLHDQYGGGIEGHEKIIREWWPHLRARVRDASDGITGVDAAVASAWETAHVLATRGTAPMRRLYFIQDYEPYFYPRGSTYALAEDTYRFGFRNIALGRMVGRALEREAGVTADVTEFGCDTGVYHTEPEAKRTGIVLYARPNVPRRGFLLACLGLERFHRTHPDVPIHLYGTIVRELPFPAEQHGRLTPAELNALYNMCIGGIAMSFTNISLVAEEMLAAGVIPVVNDSDDARADLDNRFVAWAIPTPDGIAAALSEIVSNADTARATAASESVRRYGWTQAQSDVVRILEEEVYG